MLPSKHGPAENYYGQCQRLGSFTPQRHRDHSYHLDLYYAVTRAKQYAVNDRADSASA